MELTITSTQYIYCFIAGVLGIMFHVFAVKLPALKRRSEVANKQFSIRDYFADDWIGLGSSIIAVLFAVLALKEIVEYRPGVVKYVKYLFFFVGFTGSSILLAVLSKTDKAINALVDKKTNIADKKTE